MRRRVVFGIVMLALTGGASSIGSAQENLTRNVLANADYVTGRRSFQMRCSACHTLADGGANLAGPNLWHVIGAGAAARGDFTYSDALKRLGTQWGADTLDHFLADPQRYVAGTSMAIAEGVPMPDRVALIAYLMLETGGADWPRPELPKVVIDPDRTKPVAERFASFWNHLMTNTTRYHYRTPAGEVVFRAYFNTDGSVSSDHAGIRGFWRIDERDFFCYALYGIPVRPESVVECFPIVAMSIPRFAEKLWETRPAPDTTLAGGILPGRP